MIGRSVLPSLRFLSSSIILSSRLLIRRLLPLLRTLMEFEAHIVALRLAFNASPGYELGLHKEVSG